MQDGRDQEEDAGHEGGEGQRHGQVRSMDNMIYTVCPRSSDPFYVVKYHIKWVTLLGHKVD